MSRKFIVRIDKEMLEVFVKQWVIIGEYQRWIAKLMGYAFGIEYKEGLENLTVDALS